MRSVLPFRSLWQNGGTANNDDYEVNLNLSLSEANINTAKPMEEFTPTHLSLKEIRDAVPSQLFLHDTTKAYPVLVRNIGLTAFLFKLGSFIEPLFASEEVEVFLTPLGAQLLHYVVWAIYWWFQGLSLTGLWVIGHECSHGSFCPNGTVNHAIGFVLHTALGTPYFSWRISHHRHHAFHGCMERDEVFVPKTRKEIGIPLEHEDHHVDYSEYFSDSPIYNLLLLARQQLIGWPSYLLFNASGQRHYPAGSSHFNPESKFFRKSQARLVRISTLGICVMSITVLIACMQYGVSQVWRLYGIPWMLVSHWIVMITYLQHTDPRVPHYRGEAWNFQRGAAATVDRESFLGWQGHFFLHDVAKHHTAHHFFPQMPWYRGAEVTAHLKAKLGNSYFSSKENAFASLWRTYNACQFVEDEGDILFYKGKDGKAVRK